MNTPIRSAVLTLTLLTLLPGCGTLRNFWFGRGASCGACVQAPTAPPQSGCQCGQTPYASGYSTAQDPYIDGAIGTGVEFDNGWSARRYDSNGDLIVSEGPMQEVEN